MAQSYSLAAGAALLMSVCHLASAYSGDLEIGNPSLPPMMHFDGAPAPTPHAQLPVPDGARSVTPDNPVRATSGDRRDEFQRYFDRHYRAHLVLDGATRRDTDVE